jgi:hypothetical protein
MTLLSRIFQELIHVDLAALSGPAVIPIAHLLSLLNLNKV